jgi:hypothetical protein
VTPEIDRVSPPVLRKDSLYLANSNLKVELPVNAYNEDLENPLLH